MKKTIAYILLIFMLLTSLAAIAVNAENSNLLSTDKAEYLYGEAINVTAYGSGTDWVGLF